MHPSARASRRSRVVSVVGGRFSGTPPRERRPYITTSLVLVRGRAFRRRFRGGLSLLVLGERIGGLPCLRKDRRAPGRGGGIPPARPEAGDRPVQAAEAIGKARCRIQRPGPLHGRGKTGRRTP